MKPQSPVLLKLVVRFPEIDLSEGPECYSLYESLPALVSADDYRTTTVRFKLTLKERLQLLLHGNLWLQQLTFGKSYPPCKLHTEEPPVEECL